MAKSASQIPFWRRAQVRRIAAQVVVLALVIWALTAITQNTMANLKRQSIASGLGFLQKTSGFNVIQSLIPYNESSTYARAFFVGLTNTLTVSAIGIIVATILGFLIGIARLSSNWLLARLASLYVEIVRNIPLLLQIFVWYFAVLRALPMPTESWHIGPFYLNIRGFYLPAIRFDQAFYMEWPQPGRFNIEGGWEILPEFMALVVALAIYTAAFIAEIVRAGILAVPKGQTEAASALGLSRQQTLKLVVIPQAMRVIIPPLTSQFLNLTKNSSLAAAIAYPDLVLIFAGTVLMQTGQAVEVIGITMAVYLTISLVIAGVMNRYNKRQLVGERR